MSKDERKVFSETQHNRDFFIKVLANIFLLELNLRICSKPAFKNMFRVEKIQNDPRTINNSFIR